MTNVSTRCFWFITGNGKRIWFIVRDGYWWYVNEPMWGGQTKLKWNPIWLEGDPYHEATEVELALCLLTGEPPKGGVEGR